MIPRGLKKKPQTSPLKNNNSKKKSKSKSKSKQKCKKFTAQDFLQALIDLQNTNCSTNKKKRNTTRDISSALTIATPALQKTISASKIRSRSSFSQYRKKCNGGTKEPLKINLCAIITEQDNVQYTEKTARSSYKQQQNEQNLINVEKERNIKRINQNQCAIKIQRAWRNYQTYQMVHKIYLKQKRNKQLRRAPHVYQQADKVHIRIHKPDLQKTLKIKKQHAQRKEQRKQHQFSQTQKIIKSRYKEDQNIDQRSKKSPILQMEQFSQQSRLASNSFQQDQMIIKIKQKQAQRFSQVIDLIQKQRKTKSKEQLLIQLIEKFQQNKKILQNDINKHLQCIQFSESENQQENNVVSSNNIGIKQPQIKNQVFNEEIISANYASSDSSMCLDYQSMADQMSEFKIFQQRLKMIKQEKIRKLQKIDESFIESRLTNQQATRKKQKIYARFQKQKKQIEKNKKQFIFSLTQLKKNALKCQKQILRESSSLSKLRKSFSVGNTVLKQVLQDIKLVELQNDDQQNSLVYLFKRQISLNEQNSSKPLTNTPILILPSPQKILESEQNLMDKNNTQVMKVYSEQIQQLIQKQLIQQFVKNAFVEDALFLYFKPYVEQIYEFKKIKDSDISGFMEVIKKFLPDEKTMLRRVNQKINPTSLQILRIIRDLQYQIDEYQLIIPEQCFKKYRALVEKQYEQINNGRNVDADEIIKKVKDAEMIEKVYKIELQKREKMRKYSNFERDLKIMYMKSVFNCINEFLIQTKSSNAFMNGRSSIGPGQLSLAIKQYNQVYDVREYNQLLNQVEGKVVKTVWQKCAIPSFKNYHDIELFQKQVMGQIHTESTQNQFKWVNYMDEVLEIWQDLCSSLVESLLDQAANDIISIFK